LRLLFCLNLILFSAMAMAAEWDLEQGCQSMGTCNWVNNKANRFRYEFNRPFTNHADCSLSQFIETYGKFPCPGQMTWVCSTKYQVNFCIDTNLREDLWGNPDGNFSRNRCQSLCQSQGYDLPTNNEWLVAANGTQFKDCDINIPNPCASENYSNECLKRNFNYIPGSVLRPNCVSNFGVRDMVGVLGQWVLETHEGNGWKSAKRFDQAPAPRGFFNGGLWPQKYSTVFYQTRAHGIHYGDYSIGCRCASMTRISAVRDN
jgi:hypothetical protein